MQQIANEIPTFLMQTSKSILKIETQCKVKRIVTKMGQQKPLCSNALQTRPPIQNQNSTGAAKISQKLYTHAPTKLKHSNGRWSRNINNNTYVLLKRYTRMQQRNI